MRWFEKVEYDARDCAGVCKMNRRARQIGRVGGFTLVELVTTVAIIGLLLALLVPAFNLIGGKALEVRQRGQFNRIEVALEGYRADFGDYPPSQASRFWQYSGAQKLAEAIVGWDGFGVHPDTVYSFDGTDNTSGGGNRIYALPADADWDQNVKERKGPYLELEAANAIKLVDLYGTGNTGNLAEDTYILADTFKKVTHRTTKSKIGMPVLYFKANTSAKQHSATNADPGVPVDWNLNVYNLNDNREFFRMPAPFQGDNVHRYDAAGNNWDQWYEVTTNPNFLNTTNPELSRPYRSESFILQSAGPDGLYGTPDDMFNFESEK